MNLLRQSRIKKTKEFAVVQSTGNKFWSESFLAIRTNRNDNLPLGRLGLVVSKKVSKLAVKRNLLKRIIRETFRKSPLRNAFAYDVVVVALNSAVSKENVALHAELESLWNEVFSTKPGKPPRPYTPKHKKK